MTRDLALAAEAARRWGGMKAKVVPCRWANTGRLSGGWYWKVPCDCPGPSGLPPIWPVDRLARRAGYEPTVHLAMTAAAAHIRTHHQSEETK